MVKWLVRQTPDPEIRGFITTDARACSYTTFFMLNSAEHEILTAHKCQNSSNKLNCQVKIIKAYNLSYL